MTSNPSVIEHKTREENLLAAKRALRNNRQARISRHTGTGEDIIDVMVGSDVVERHVCRFCPYIPSQTRRRPFCVEELALYQ